jgi:hypothetical protein
VRGRIVHGDVVQYLHVRSCGICEADVSRPLDDFGWIFRSSCGRCFEDGCFASEIIPASSAAATLPLTSVMRTVRGHLEVASCNKTGPEPAEIRMSHVEHNRYHDDG